MILPKVMIGVASDAEVQPALELAARVFGSNDHEAMETKNFLLSAVEPLASSADLVIARERGDVVGLVRMVPRQLRFGADLFNATGLTSVAVAPSHRGRGIGVRLVRASLEEGRRRGGDLSVLFARRAVDGWYSRFGFVGIAQHVELRIADRVSPQTIGPLARVRCVSGFVQESVSSYRGAYKATYQGLPGSFVRSSDWWKRLAARVKIRARAEFLTLRNGRDVVGYAVVEGDRISEISVRRGFAAGAAASIVHLLRGRGHSAPAFCLQPLHPVMGVLYGVGHTIAIRRAWDGGHMICSLTRRAKSRLESHAVSFDAATSSASDFRLWPVWSVLDEF